MEKTLTTSKSFKPKLNIKQKKNKKQKKKEKKEKVFQFTEHFHGE